MAGASTSISELPTTQQTQQGGNAVQLEIQEQVGQHLSGVSGTNQTSSSINGIPAGVENAKVGGPPIQLSNSDITKIVEGIQMASSQNMTQLPSRDIPMNQQQFTNDSQVQPNKVPKEEKRVSFVEDFASQNDNNFREKQINKERTQQVDDIFDKLQTPIIISILFLLFQMPIFDKILFRNFPTFFIKEGSLGLSGFLVKSLIFGSVYFICQNIISSLIM